MTPAGTLSPVIVSRTVERGVARLTVAMLMLVLVSGCFLFKNDFILDAPSLE